MTADRPYPGLVKSKRAPLVETRVRRWIRSTDYRWRELFEKADVVSEGAVRSDGDGPTYYGSTHIRFPNRLSDDELTDHTLTDLHRLIRNDPHVRLRAIRIACLEAQVRSPSGLLSIRTEVSFADTPEALLISVDVEAQVASNTLENTRQSTLHRNR